jgi:hypothetical protein
MKRRWGLFLVILTGLIGLAALASADKPALPVSHWASKASFETPPLAIVIEMGRKDRQPRAWSGRAQVEGARVVARQGYRFHKDDRLVEPDGWKVSTHYGFNFPVANPAVRRGEPVATVGIVLYLADVKADAVMKLEPEEGASGQAVVPLKELLTGIPHLIWDGAAVVRRLSAAVPLTNGGKEDDFPAAAYGPDGTLWVAYISYSMRKADRRIQQGTYSEQPANFRGLFIPEYADQLFVKYYRDGHWSAPLALTGPHEDLMRCAIAVAGSGTIHVVYGAHRQDRFDLYTRAIVAKLSAQASAEAALKPGPEQRLTQMGGPHLNPVLCTDHKGDLLLAYQSWDAPATTSGVATMTNRQGRWKPLGDSQHPCWSAAVAADGTGKVALAFDAFRDGDYDVFVKVMDKDQVVDYAIATSGRFEARPSLCYDAKGRLWIAYEEGPEKWGHDFGALDAEDGNPLYNSRAIRVVCVENGRLFEPAAKLPTSIIAHRSPGEKTVLLSNPRLGLDGKGRLWLTYRQKFGNRYTTRPGSYWQTFARRLDGAEWTAPQEVHHSDGLLDARPALLPHPAGGLLVVHNADGRYTTPEVIANRIFASVVDCPGDVLEPKLVAAQPQSQKDVPRAAEEREAVRRIRNHRVKAGGKEYHLLRGEFHRHTETSWDGGLDGSLEDMFRYAIDVAALDWIGNGDHDNGAGREYTWWLTQKLTDAYHVSKVFTPVFSYERSVNYPDGHRNCVFAQRGVLPLPRLSKEKVWQGSVHPDDTKMLYRYLHEFDGICASHTSATNMGTDWRDNDPQVEPVVEIYQGDRMSYEHEGAPRAGYDPKTGKLPAQIGGWKPAGFIDHALKKGYRLGFQSSSDHWSTHISFCIVLAESHDRVGIVAGLKKRHCYAATDDIILDIRSGDHVMGDELKMGQAPVLQLHVEGTKALARVDILKDSQVVATVQPGQRLHKQTWTDPEPTAGVHYYYVRVEQTDGELAWSSPMWIDYAP